MGEPTVADVPPKEIVAKGKPLYRKLSDALREEIIAGSYAVGSLLPTEQELCNRFQTSRYTVREALRLLTTDDLIVRRQGRGSEVASQQKRPAYAQSLTSLSELYAYAKDTKLVIDHVETIVPDDVMALQLGRKSGRAWLTAEGTRRAPDGAIICTSRIYIYISTRTSRTLHQIWPGSTARSTLRSPRAMQWKRNKSGRTRAWKELEMGSPNR